MTMSMVVVNFHSSAYVRSCLTAVDASWCSVVVIVDNSVDAEEEQRLRQLTLEVPVVVIAEDRNLGFGGAANHGIARALAIDPEAPVWLVNPDTRFSKATAAALDRRAQLGLDDIFSPVVVTGNEDDRRIWFAGGSVDGSTGNLVHDDYLRPVGEVSIGAAVPTSFMSGAAPVFTPRAWSILGGFREDLFLYWEDAELSLRANDARLRMTVVGDIPPLWHAVGGTGGDSGQSTNFYYYSARNRILVMLERGAAPALIKPGALIELAKFALRPLRRERQRTLRKIGLVLVGYAHGIRTWSSGDKAEVRG